jgi:beta-lactamase superfamily II metal-dependent hydrolase
MIAMSGRSGMVVVALALAVVIVAGFAGESGAGLTIYCLDVGQGDCTIIVSPTGGTLLFDAGINGKGNNTIIPYLQGLGITALDYVACSHYHVDHIGGLDEVVNSLGIDSIRVAALDRGWSYTTATYTSYAAAVAPKRTTILDGQVIDLGGGVTVTCIGVNGNGQLSPPFDDKYDENDLCVALLVEYGDFDFFVAGDLSGSNSSGYHDIETSIASEVGDIDIYRVDHHGSASNSNAYLVSTFEPEVSVISVGSNSYGHPTQTVIDRLVNNGSYIYQTELGSGGTIPSGEGEVVGGHIVISVDGGSYTVNGDVYHMAGAGVRIVREGFDLRAYPNPFNTSTTFSFVAPAGGAVRLGVYDAAGRLVDLLSEADSGQGTVTWMGTASGGGIVSPGVYFVRVEGPSGAISKKVVKR